MIRDLFVLVENDLWPVITASIKATMPDVLVTYIALVGQDVNVTGPMVRVTSMDDDALAATLDTYGYGGPCFILPSSALVLRDFRPALPPELDKFATGVSRRYMHASEACHCSRYDALGLDYKATSDRVRFVNPGRVGMPNPRTITMSLKMRYGADRAVLDVLSGPDLVAFSRDALSAHIIDFGREAMDPAMTVDECYAYPFDVYAAHARAVAGQLPKNVMAVIERNSVRSRIAAAMRAVLV